MTDPEESEQLKQRLTQAIGELRPKDVGVAFSGGIDSSVLAKLCKGAGKNATLFTVGFNDEIDIKVASEVAGLLGLNLHCDLVSLEELKNGLKIVLERIVFERIVRFENCVCFYYVFRLASKHGLKTVVSANGMDELFCGYSIYKTHFGDEDETKSLMKNLVDAAYKDKIEMDKLASLFGIDYVCPFMSEEFVDFAMSIPLDCKIKGVDDDVRKHILREVALSIGVPLQAALKPKKAFQYSSGIHKAITELAKNKGFTKTKAKTAGFISKMDAYISSLKYVPQS
jgi:asparagine synthase (glutamine-hydrolysing)